LAAHAAATRASASEGTPSLGGVDSVEVPDIPPPDPEQTEKPTLAQLLAFADLHSPDVLVARQRAARGDAEVAAAALPLQENPEIAAASGSRTFDGRTSGQFEASVSQRVEIAGQRGLRREAANRDRRAALAELDAARWQVQVLVRRLFAEARLASARRELADEAFSFAQNVVEIARGRVAAGDEPEMSLLVPQSDLARAREQLVAARQDELAVGLELARTVGWPSGRALEPSGLLPAVRKLPPLDQLLELALRHQPEVRKWQAAVAAAEARVRLEDRLAWPDPALGASYAREGEVAGATNVWLLSLALPLPIWNRNQGARAHARVDLGIAQAEERSVRGNLELALRQAASAVNAAADRVQIYGSDVVPPVQHDLELVRRAFDAGEIDAERVSVTLDRVLATRGQSLRAQDDYFGALRELEELLGTAVPASEDR